MVRSSLVKGAVAAAAMLAATATLGAAPRQLWGPGYGMGPGMMGGGGLQGRGPGYGMGPGMMGRGFGGYLGEDLPPLDKPLTLDAVPARVGTALQSWGYANLVVDEVIQFSAAGAAQVGWGRAYGAPMAALQDFFYVLVKEKDTGKGALELLVDPRTGAVTTEPGPAMMWNTKYGHRMLYTGAAATDIGLDKAKEAARQWLGARGDTTAYELDATPMYGYYSIHLLRDGKVEGMLGVNASTGAVWYHAWHGDFVASKDFGK